MEFPEEDFSEPEQGGSPGAASRQTDKQSKTAKSNRLQKRGSTSDKASLCLLNRAKTQMLILAGPFMSVVSYASGSSSECRGMNLLCHSQKLSHNCRDAPAVEPQPHQCGDGEEKQKRSCFVTHVRCVSGGPQEDQTGKQHCPKLSHLSAVKSPNQREIPKHKSPMSRPKPKIMIHSRTQLIHAVVSAGQSHQEKDWAREIRDHRLNPARVEAYSKQRIH